MGLNSEWRESMNYPIVEGKPITIEHAIFQIVNKYSDNSGVYKLPDMGRITTVSFDKTTSMEDKLLLEMYLMMGYEEGMQIPPDFREIAGLAYVLWTDAEDLLPNDKLHANITSRYAVSMMNLRDGKEYVKSIPDCWNLFSWRSKEEVKSKLK